MSRLYTSAISLLFSLRAASQPPPPPLPAAPSPSVSFSPPASRLRKFIRRQEWSPGETFVPADRKPGVETFNLSEAKTEEDSMIHFCFWRVSVHAGRAPRPCCAQGML